MHSVIRFCSHCGNPTTERIPEGDSLPRQVCSVCQTIHYQNPRLVVGTLPIWEDSVLLCRRAIAPRKGYWTLPAGFMENGESAEEAALRETEEEARARVTLQGLYVFASIPAISQVHLLYRAQLEDTRFSPGPESLECRLFPLADIPWKDLAFRSITFGLQRYGEDAGSGRYPLHSTVLAPILP